MITYRKIAHEGLWKNNPALVQLLGLCPLLAVTNSLVNALGLALATLGVLMGSNLVISLLRRRIPNSVRLPAFVLIIASFVTGTELLMQAWTYELYQVLGIFIPLIVTNCMILGRAEAFASRHSPPAALFDGLMVGLGFGCVLLLLGGMRELLGQGRLLSDMELLLGPWAANWQLTFWTDFQILIFLLPPGAFFGMGLLIALKNAADLRRRSRAAAHQIFVRDQGDT